MDDPRTPDPIRRDAPRQVMPSRSTGVSHSATSVQGLPHDAQPTPKPIPPDNDALVDEPITHNTGAPVMTDEKGIHIEHHDHDTHPHGAYAGLMPAYGMGHSHAHGQTWGIWGIFAFVGFIVIIWAVWGYGRRGEEHHNRDTDKHHDTQRCMDKIGYEQGYIHKQLADMQSLLTYNSAQQVAWREDNLRWGLPYGEHTQRLCTAAPAYCGERRSYGGGIMNGSQVSDTKSFAVDHSVF